MGGERRCGEGGRSGQTSDRENGEVIVAPSRATLLRALGVTILVVTAIPVVRHYLIRYPVEIWQVDLEVYREAARALVSGFPLYDVRTPPPQFLPFTYPPFAALVGLPLAIGSFTAVGWAWTVLQLVLLWVTVGMAFRPFLDRFGDRRGLVQGLLASCGVLTMPVLEGIRFGQVNAVVVALCLADVARRVPEGGLRMPRGVLVGLAAAVKLTPAAFWVHWAVARRWRTLAISVGTAAGVTLVTALLLPAASARFWTDALLDPERLGPNAGTSNQSLRGVLLRVWPGDPGLGTVLWLVLVVLVGGAGFWLSARLDRLGEPVAVVAVVGLVALLVSPVSWVHHYHWCVVVVAVLLGDGRRWQGVAAATVLSAALWARLPWLGLSMLEGDLPRWIGRTAQNGFALLAVAALAMIWWLMVRTAERQPRSCPVTTNESDRPAWQRG